MFKIITATSGKPKLPKNSKIIATVEKKRNIRGDSPSENKFLVMIEDAIDGTELKISIPNEIFFPLPKKKIVEKIYISAPSGAGKSTFVGKWLNMYKKMFPRNPIYLFSAILEDQAIDIHDPIRISLDSDLIDDPIDPQDLKNSVVVFDDIDTLQNKQIRDAIMRLRDILLECGRHFNIRMLITSHIMCDYKKTRLTLTESTSIVVFPSASSTHHLKRYLQTYAGFDQAQIKKFMNLKSRWVYFSCTYPQYILYDKGVYLANES